MLHKKCQRIKENKKNRYYFQEDKTKNSKANIENSRKLFDF